MNEEFSRFNPDQRIAHHPKLKDKDGFSQAINVLLNYWEIKPTQYEARLHELALKDVKTVSAFLPWAHIETDIYHSLKKFLRAAWATRLHVRLFVMPELGVNYPNAGFPKDLLGNVANLAVDRLGQVIYSTAAPGIFPMPSFSSPEVLKRFGNYLIKVGSTLAEVFTEAGNLDFCEVVVTNSLFNYYRSHGLPLRDQGDYSAAHVMAFRDFLDREYRSANGAADNEQFKMQLYESYNRHRFFTHVEKLLREKTDMVFARKSSACAVRHIDLFNPECAPESAYEGLLTEILDFRPSVQRFYGSIVAGGYRGEAIHLDNTGTFRRFSDQEKSFLILAALIRSGEVSVPAAELFRFSPQFQRKLRGLVEFLSEHRLVRQSQVTYVAASKFSMEPRSFEMLSGMLPSVMNVSAGIAHDRPHGERLVFMDPRAVIRSMEMIQLLAVAQGGKVVAIPAPMSQVSNYTADALVHLEKFRKGRQPLRVNLGLAYEVYEYHLGQVVLFDPQAFWRDDAAAAGDADGMSRFFQALLGLAEARAACAFSDPRLHVTSYVSELDPSRRVLFLVNPATHEIHGTLTFQDPVALAGLPQAGAGGAIPNPLTGKSFELVVPPLGVLPVQVTQSFEGDTEAPGATQWT